MLTILDWSDDSLNAIDSEYIIITGVLLHQKWSTMSGVQQITCIAAIFKNFKQVAAFLFSNLRQPVLRQC
jgi:hypothetical protein